VLTLRQNPNKRDQPEDPSQPPGPKNQIQPAQGKPGQDLLWPGEFIFGYPRQIPEAADDAEGLNPHPGPNSLIERGGTSPAAPEWAKDGSFLVFRRLHQDVGGFHRFLHDSAKNLGVEGTNSASAAQLVGSKLSDAGLVERPYQRLRVTKIQPSLPAIARTTILNSRAIRISSKRFRTIRMPVWTTS